MPAPSVQLEVLSPSNYKDSLFTKDEIAQFLFVSLERFGDPLEDIHKCLDYAFSDKPGFGGVCLVAYRKKEILGVVVVNETNFKGYIPENILVYIAVKASTRGQGIGKYLLTETKKQVKGALALHVEPDNPARFLYQSVGFSNKYLEMRW
ncbi:hypothetical protein P9112_000356 [Eukaryota sp. TZLM1-RC]